MKGNTNSLVSSGDGKILKTEYIIEPEKASQNVTPEYTEKLKPFEDEQTGGKSYDGLSDIKVRKIGSWIDAEISADNIRTGHTILGVSGNVVELQGEERTVKSTTSVQTITPSSGKNGITKVTVNPVVYQSKTTSPKMTSQTIYADGGYDALSSVTVNAIDLEYLKEQEPDLLPQNIKKGVDIFTVVGTYDPQFTTQTKTVNPTTYTQTVYADSGYDGLSRVTVNPVTSSIDSDIVAGNIRKDVNILGVTGTYEGRQPVITTINETSTITPTITQQNFNVPSGYDGYSSFKVNPVTSDIDANILPKNIKRNVEILGVMGTYTTENLQEKVATPTKQQQVITYDDDVYEGLKQVTITGVTSAIDENIKAENIKKDVEILGVTGTYEETFTTEEKIVTPTKVAQTVTPSEGYDGLSKVSVEGVTSAIDANILAENIKKGIEILGVTGSLESASYNFQSNKEVTPTVAEQNIKPDLGYDALLNVIVKAVTASIDPNILPKNIKKDIQILGVVGTLIEGEEQQYFDFRNISDYYANSGHHFGGGGQDEITNVMVEDTDYSLSTLSYNIPAVKDVTAVLFQIVTGYDDLESTDPTLYQTYIYFTGGKYWDTSYNLTIIKDQLRYIYPYTNDYNVDGCLLNCDDVADEHTYKLYVLINSEDNTNVPVLVDGTFDASMYPTVTGVNATKIGSPTVSSDYVVSGFNASNYYKHRQVFNPASYSWETHIKITTGSSIKTSEYFYGCTNNSNSFLIGISNNCLGLWLSSNGSSWDINAEITSSTILTNTTYYIKLTFDLSKYVLSYSTDDENWTIASTVTSSTPIYSGSYIYYGTAWDSSTCYFSGNFDFKEFYLKINDVEVWKGVDTVQLFDTNRYVSEITVPAHNRFEPKIHTKNYRLFTSWVLRDRKGVTDIVTEHTDRPLTIDVSAFDKNYGEEEIITPWSYSYSLKDGYNTSGSPTISSDHIVSNFSASNYIVSPKTASSNYFDMIQKVYFNGGSDEQCIWWTGNDRPIAIISNHYGVYQSGWHYSSESFSAGTYWFRFIYKDSTGYFYYIKDNDETYNLENLPELSDWNLAYSYGGLYNAWTGQTIELSRWNSTYWKGTMDLKGTKITDSNGVWWQPYQINVSGGTNHEIILLTEDLLFYRREDELTEEYGTRGNLVNYLDYGNAVTMPLYTVTQDDEQVYIFSPDDTFIDGETYKDGMFVDNIDIPEHTPYLWNNTTKSFDVKKIITVNIADEDARLYTTTEEGE